MSGVLVAIGRLLTRVVLCADRVAVTIPAYVEVLRDRYGATNVYLAPHGTFGEPRDLDLTLPERPRLMTFGKFGTYKRVEILIEAYRELLHRGHDVELMIAGSDSPNSPGYLDGVRTANRDLEHISFTGYVAALRRRAAPAQCRNDRGGSQGASDGRRRRLAPAAPVGARPRRLIGRRSRPVELARAGQTSMR